jgi:hypothetical protein
MRREPQHDQAKALFRRLVSGDRCYVTCTTELLKLIGTPSQRPQRVLVPPLVGELGTLRVHDMSPSELVNDTCNPVGPTAVAPPAADVVS